MLQDTKSQKDVRYHLISISTLKTHHGLRPSEERRSVTDREDSLTPTYSDTLTTDRNTSEEPLILL